MEPIEHKWIRKAFPHVEPESVEHREIAAKLRSYIDIEESKTPWNMTRSIVLQPPKGMDLRKEVDAAYERKKGKVNVFEVGCGRGYALRTLGIFKGGIANLDGITLTQSAADHAAGKHDVDGPVVLQPQNTFGSLAGMIMGNVPTVKVRTGIIEGLELRDQDLIFAFQTMRYVIDKAKALEVIANGLARGGKAILHVPGYFLGKHERHVKDYLERNGIKFRKKRARTVIGWPKEIRLALGRGKTTIDGNYFLILERSSDTKVDLSRFYKIRTKDYWQNPSASYKR